MKHPAGYARPRRLAAPKKQTRLNLQQRRAQKPEPENYPEPEVKSTFWKWVLFIAVMHAVVLGIISFFYAMTPTPKSPEPFIQLLPQGDLVKGSPSPQEAPKVGQATPAPSIHHDTQPPPTPTVAVKPPPKPEKPKPIVKTQAPTLVPDKPVPPKPPKPKVKVDLNVVDGPNADKPAPKPKHHPKPAPATPTKPVDAPENATSNPNSSGLSKEQIAAKLGEKLDAAGTRNAEKTGTSGAVNGKENSFSDFYQAIHDQVMDRWTAPILPHEPSVYPKVQIHVEKDGSVPPDRVKLLQSSGNTSYDNSALDAARSIGRLYQPLPDGCPPDISINFKLNL